MAQFGGTVVGSATYLSVIFSCKGILFCIGLTTGLVGASADVYLFQPGQIEGTVGIDKFNSVGVAMKEGFGLTGHTGAGISVPVVNVAVTLFCFDKNGDVYDDSGVMV